MCIYVQSVHEDDPEQNFPVHCLLDEMLQDPAVLDSAETHTLVVRQQIWSSIIKCLAAGRFTYFPCPRFTLIGYGPGRNGGVCAGCDHSNPIRQHQAASGHVIPYETGSLDDKVYLGAETELLSRYLLAVDFSRYIEVLKVQSLWSFIEGVIVAWFG